MKLASYLANGKDAFGVVTGDGVVTMNERLGGRDASLRDALTAGALAAIGGAGRHIPVGRALEHVAGYTCFVDGSVRDYQKFSVTSGKNFPATGPLGPWIVTTDEIPDPTRLTLTTRLNGQEVQKSGTDLLIYSVPQIIAFCSDFTPLVPGDVIATGTPEGVGHRRNPPLWMKPGDVLEVEISGIGTLRSRVVDERT